MNSQGEAIKTRSEPTVKQINSSLPLIYLLQDVSSLKAQECHWVFVLSKLIQLVSASWMYLPCTGIGWANAMLSLSYCFHFWHPLACHPSQFAAV